MAKTSNEEVQVQEEEKQDGGGQRRADCHVTPSARKLDLPTATTTTTSTTTIRAVLSPRPPPHGSHLSVAADYRGGVPRTVFQERTGLEPISLIFPNCDVPSLTLPFSFSTHHYTVRRVLHLLENTRFEFVSSRTSQPDSTSRISQLVASTKPYVFPLPCLFLPYHN